MIIPERISFVLNKQELQLLHDYLQEALHQQWWIKSYRDKLFYCTLKNIYQKKVLPKFTFSEKKTKITLTVTEALAFHETIYERFPCKENQVLAIAATINQKYA